MSRSTIPSPCTIRDRHETIGNGGASTWNDIDLERRTIRINKSRYIDADNDHPKTTKSGRTFTIAKALTELESKPIRSKGSRSKCFLNKFGEPLNASSSGR